MAVEPMTDAERNPPMSDRELVSLRIASAYPSGLDWHSRTIRRLLATVSERDEVVGNYEAMKEGVAVRIQDLESELARESAKVKQQQRELMDLRTELGRSRT
jgi:hypothetical protein